MVIVDRKQYVKKGTRVSGTCSLSRLRSNLANVLKDGNLCGHMNAHIVTKQHETGDMVTGRLFHKFGL